MSNFASCLEFNVKLQDMLKNLIIWFPAEKHFVEARNRMELAMKYKIREPMSQFLTAVFPYRNEILERNLRFFTQSAESSDHEALKMFNFGQKVNSLSSEEKDQLWAQLTNLLLLAEKASPTQVMMLKNNNSM